MLLKRCAHTCLPALLLAIAYGCSGPAVDEEAAAAPRALDRPASPPNIVMILVDDMRWDEYGGGGHPYLETPHIDRLQAEGVRFTHAFHAVPLCSPNRASLLTGQYPSRHGIIDNVARDIASHRLRTFPQALQQSGYETAFIGKWHMGNDASPRPGFDVWSGLPGQGRISDPVLHENGRASPVSGYVTDVLTERALTFIDRDRDRPFFLLLSHKAIHPDAHQRDDGSVDLDYGVSFIPAQRHAGRYADRVFPRRPNVPAATGAIASAAARSALELRASEPITSVFGNDFLDPLTAEATIRQRAEMMLAVDESVGRIVAVLQERGILDQTLILFTSDNGYFFGEHGFSIERRMPYDESIRMPLLVRYPPMIAAGTQADGLASSIDIAPTLLDVAGAPISDHIQGRSLLPLLAGDTADWRASVLIEFYSYENPMPWLVDMDYRAVRTRQYKYIHWLRFEDELYDVVADPYEQHNLVAAPRMAQVGARLRSELGRLTVEAIGLAERH